MSNREFWFYGDGVDLCHLEDFCSLSQYEKLVEDVRCYELSLPHPLDAFKDDNGEDAIVVMPYQIDPLGGTEQLKPISFYERRQNTHDFSRGMNAGCWVEGVEKK